jgi:hypothetical protein
MSLFCCFATLGMLEVYKLPFLVMLKIIDCLNVWPLLLCLPLVLLVFILFFFFPLLSLLREDTESWDESVDSYDRCLYNAFVRIVLVEEWKINDICPL